MMTGCALALGLLWAAPALAEDELDCRDPQTQHDMNMCANQDFEVADKELNEVWKKARDHAKAVDEEQWEDSLRGAEKALLNAQRGWIPYRDGSCELYGFEARGGSMEPMLVSGCKATMTKARTKELRDFIAGPQ
ncbi:MAG: lysozyme inhibitor LprI family protein [Rhizobiaceae bacterium]